MKKIFALLIFLVLASSAFAALQPDDVALKISFVNQDPALVQPGDYVDLKVRIENEGQMTASDVTLTLVEKYPFSLDPGTAAVQEVGTVGALQKDDFGIIVTYKLRVARDAVEGTNKVELQIDSKNTKMQSAEFDIEVKTQDVGLVIDSVSSDVLEPGKKGFLEIKVANPSDSVLRDVKVQVDLTSATLPIAPVDSGTSKSIQILNSNQESLFRFALMPFPDAEAQVYKVPINISYYNSLNELVQKNEIVGLVVGSDADVRIFAESSDFIAEANKGTVTVNFVNKGLTDIKFLDLVLEDTDDYEVISSSEEYVGNVDSDDFETADFMILRKSGQNQFDLKLKVEFKDANNNDYSQDVMLPVTLYSGGNGGASTLISFITFIIIVIIGVPLIYAVFKIIVKLLKLVGKFL